MFKKLIFLFLTITIMLSACGTFEISIDPTPTPPPTATQTVRPTTTPETKPTATKTLNTPKFSNPAFYQTSLKPANCAPEYGDVFPARILQVHAQWDYANMRAGLTIRREWYSNGKLWARYDEPWNFVKYGADGIIHDVPIYDLDAGLEPGDYELRLYINEEPQFDPAEKIGFRVDEDWAMEVISPNGRLTGIISRPQKLMIRESNGTKWELVNAHNITSLAWFADSKHIVYSDSDRTLTKGCSDIDIRHTLWIVDAATSNQYQIGGTAENLHGPLLSPDEKYIAALSGSGYGDACLMDSKPVFIELSGLQRIRSFSLQDFTGIPTAVSGSSIYTVNRGIWQDATRFEIGLSWTCNPNNPGGIYSFDLENKQATRIGDLP